MPLINGMRQRVNKKYGPAKDFGDADVDDEELSMYAMESIIYDDYDPAMEGDTYDDENAGDDDLNIEDLTDEDLEGTFDDEEMVNPVSTIESFLNAVDTDDDDDDDLNVDLDAMDNDLDADLFDDEDI